MAGHRAGERCRTCLRPSADLPAEGAWAQNPGCADREGKLGELGPGGQGDVMCPRLASARLASATRWAASPCSQVHSMSAADRAQPHNLPHRICLALVDKGQLARSPAAGRRARQQPPRQLVPLGPHSPRPPLHRLHSSYCHVACHRACLCSMPHNSCSRRRLAPDGGSLLLPPQPCRRAFGPLVAVASRCKLLRPACMLLRQRNSMTTTASPPQLPCGGAARLLRTAQHIALPPCRRPCC